MLKKVIPVVVLLILIACPDALATQEHADPEGLYTHQIAHLFFMFSMAVLFIQIKRVPTLPRGWRFIGIAAFLFLLWNIDTFTVHWIREPLSPEFFSGSVRAWTQKIDISTLIAKVFYAGKILDHFLSVGAMAAFVMGIKSFKDEKEEP